MNRLEKEEIILRSKGIFLLGSKTSFSESIKFIPGKCAIGLNENQIEQGQICSFLAADPVKFTAKVLGKTEISGYPSLVLELLGGNKVFSNKNGNRYTYLQLSEN